MDETSQITQSLNPPVMPFWQRMPRLWLFPLQRAPLTRIVIAAVVLCVAMGFLAPQFASAPLRTGFLTVVSWVGATLYIAQYAFLVIERSSAGYLHTRSWPVSFEKGDWRRPAKMFVVLVFMPFLILLVGTLLLRSPLLVLLVMLVFVLLLPASVIVMTMTDSFFDAINPVHCANTALRIGAPYLLLCLFLLLLVIGSQQAMHLLVPGPTAHPPPAPDLPPAPPAEPSTLGFVFTLFVITLVGNYFLVLTCALIGYVMYQYSAELGIEVVGPGDGAGRGPISSAAHARRVREAMIGKMVAAGEVNEAIGLLSEEISARPSDVSLHARLHTLLLHEGSRPRIEEHAERYLEMLLAAGNQRDGLELYEKTRAMFPAFTPRDVARLPQLAAAALEVNNTALAAELIRGFDRKYPGHARIPDAYVIGARVMLLSGRTQEAQALFTHVARTWPDTPGGQQARRFLPRFGAGGATTLPGGAPTAGGAATPPTTQTTPTPPPTAAGAKPRA